MEIDVVEKILLNLFIENLLEYSFKQELIYKTVTTSSIGYIGSNQIVILIDNIHIFSTNITKDFTINEKFLENYINYLRDIKLISNIKNKKVNNNINIYKEIDTFSYKYNVNITTSFYCLKKDDTKFQNITSDEKFKLEYIVE